MKRICTKCIVAALILSMGITAGIPAYAAQPQTTAATEQAAQLSLEETASQYFENYPSDKHVVSAEQLLNRVEEGESFCLLDIRSAEDYAKGHIQGAVNIPYGADVADALEIIPNDQPVLVYCYSGQTASQTVALLRLAGKDAYNVSGGFNKGISKQEAAEKLMTTEPASFDDKTYAVDADIKAAVENYYKQVEKAEYAKNNISPKQLKQLMESGEEVFIADLRSEEDYGKGHIEGAVSLPYGKGMQEKFDILPTDQTIYVYCYSGQTASQTMAALRLKGYTVYNLSGGMGAEGGSGWLGAGYEVTAR